MMEKQQTKRKTRNVKRIGIIGLAVLVILSLICVGAFCVWENVFSHEGVGAQKLRETLADPAVEEVTVTGTVYLSAPVEVKGNKTILGSGKIKAAANWTAEADYMLTLSENSQLVLSDKTVVDGKGRCGGIYVSQGAQLTLSGEAKVRDAAQAYCNVMSVGAVTLDGGTLENAGGHNLYVEGEASLMTGTVSGSGENHAAVYVSGTASQMGVVIADGYDNVYIADGASFRWSGGENNDASNNGIYVAEGAQLTSDSLANVMSNAGKQGIHLHGKAVIDDIFLKESGENQIKIEKTGHLTLNNGAFDASRGNGITNRGTMIMFGGEITNSAQVGIVCSGELEITGGRVFASGEQGVLLRNGTNAVIHGQDFSASSNYIGLVVEENATAEVYDCNINSNTLYNFSSYGELYLHDIITGGSGSNCIVARYNGHILAENMTVSGTNGNNGIGTENGALVELYNVTVDGAKTNGIRTLDATLIAKDLTITNSGRHGISMSDYELQGAGSVKLENVTMEGNKGANISLETDCSGTMEIINASLGKCNSNNISAKGGHLILTDVDILGNMENTASNHGIMLDSGCKITATNLLIQDTLKAGMRVRGGDFEGTNVTMKNLGATGISFTAHPDDQRCGNLTIDGLVIDGAYDNNIHTDCDGIIKITNGTLGKVWSNSVRIVKGTVILNDVKVLGHTKETKSANEHGFFIDGGKLGMDNVTVQDTKAAGIRYAGGVVEGKDVKILNAGSVGIFANDGSKIGAITLDGLEISGSAYENISLDSSVSTHISNATLGVTTGNNNIRLKKGNVTLENVKILGATNTEEGNDYHGLLISGGDISVSNIEIQNCRDAVRVEGGTSTITQSNLHDCRRHGVNQSDGTITLNNTNITNVGSVQKRTNDEGVEYDYYDGSGIWQGGGEMKLETVNIDGSMEHGILAYSGTITGNTVTIRNIRHTDGQGVVSRNGIYAENDTAVVDITGLDINTGRENIYIKNGKVTLTDAKLTDAARNAVSVGAGSLTVKNSSIEGPANMAMDIWGDAPQVSLSNVTVSKLLDNKTGIKIGGAGTVLKANGLTIDGGSDAIRLENGSAIITDSELKNSGRHGINVGNSGKEGEYAALELQDVTIFGAGQDGINCWGNSKLTFKNTLTIDQVKGCGISISDKTCIADAQILQISNTGKQGLILRNGEVTAEQITVTKTGTNAVETVNGTLKVGKLYTDGGSFALRVSGGVTQILGGELKNTNRSAVAIDAGQLLLDGVKITGAGEDGINAWGEAEKQIVLKDAQISQSRKNGLMITSGNFTISGNTVIAENGNHGINNKGTMLLSSGYVYGNNTNAGAFQDVHNEGELVIGRVTVGYDEKGNDLGGQIFSASMIGFDGSTVSDIHAAEGKAMRLDVSDNTGVISFSDAIVAKALKDSFTATGGLSQNENILYIATGVAMVGNRNYSTLAEAVTAAKEGLDKKVILLGDVTITEAISIEGQITITDDGTARKIIRGEGLTGEMFTLAENAKLTLCSTGTAASPKLILDGSNVAATAPAIKLTANKTLQIEAGVKLMNNNNTADGGMIQVTGGALTVDGVVFEGNQAPGKTAAAIGIWSGSQVTIQNAVFQNNNAAWGGAVYINGTGIYEITNTTFRNNQGQAGGAINVSGNGAKLMLSGVTFEKNTSSARGGAIYGENGAYVELNTSKLTENKSNGNLGGAIYLRKNATLSASDCSFEKNSATEGGAVMLDHQSGTGTQAAFIRCTFKENTATKENGNGGAIYTYSGNAKKTSLTVADCQFEDNSAQLGKDIAIGAFSTITVSATETASAMDVYLHEKVITVTGLLKDGSWLTLNWKNTPAENEDVVKFDSEATAKANVGKLLPATPDLAGKSFVISGTAARLLQPAVVAKLDDTPYATLEEAFAAAKDGDTIVLTANAILNKTVEVSGKTVTLTDDGTTRVIYRGSALTDKMFNVTGTLNLTGTAADRLRINGNCVVSTGNTIAVGNGAVLTAENVVMDGLNGGTYNNGVIYLPKGSLATFTGVTVCNGTGNIIYINGAHAQSKAHSFTNCTFQNNKTTVAGSAFNISGSAKVVITGCTVSDNETSHRGAIYVEKQAQCTIENCVFENNKSTNNRGGAIYVRHENTKVTVTNSSFSGNTAKSGGDAIYAEVGTVLILNGCTGEDEIFMENGVITADVAAVAETAHTPLAEAVKAACAGMMKALLNNVKQEGQ